MNKADLVNLVSAATGETKTVVSSIVDTTIETIVDSVVEGKKSLHTRIWFFRAKRSFCKTGIKP
jgi:nucleoid DNA-binding protein